jgi:hypothetical protein
MRSGGNVSVVCNSGETRRDVGHHPTWQTFPTPSPLMDRTTTYDTTNLNDKVDDTEKQPPTFYRTYPALI